MDSRQVAWFEVYTFAERLAARHNAGADKLAELPIPGTPAWCELSDDDTHKLLALVLGGVREALAHDVRQEAMAEASRQISTMADWSRAGRGRGPAYIPRQEIA